MPDFTRFLQRDLKGMRIGVPKEYLPDEMDAVVRQAMRRRSGSWSRWAPPSTATSRCRRRPTPSPCYYIIAPSEAMANLARYDGVKYGFSFQEGESMWDNMERTRQYGFGDEVKRRIMLGTFALSAGYYDAYYLKAQKVRTLIRREFDAAFAKFDALVTPRHADARLPHRREGRRPLRDVPQRHLHAAHEHRRPARHVGAGGLLATAAGGRAGPGKPFDEASLLRVAYAYEQATAWHKAHPPL